MNKDSIISELVAELKASPCPGGGYNGQPEGEEPTVDNCLKAGVCGCSAGAAVKKATRRNECGHLRNMNRRNEEDTARALDVVERDFR